MSAAPDPQGQLSDRDWHLVNLSTVTRYEAIARDLRALAEAAEREVGRVGTTRSTRLATATEFVRQFHNAIPNLGLAHLVSTAAQADLDEAEIRANTDTDTEGDQ